MRFYDLHFAMLLLHGTVLHFTICMSLLKLVEMESENKKINVHIFKSCHENKVAFKYFHGKICLSFDGKFNTK